MGVISEKDILNTLEEYFRTPEGKKLLKKNGLNNWDGTFWRHKHLGVDPKDVDSILCSIRREFITAVQDVIKSFRGEGVFYTHGEIGEDGSIKADIFVDEGALRRESIHYMKKSHTSAIPHIGHGDGVDDILALFSNGYTVHKKRPFGFWVRDPATNSSGKSMERIGAKLHRDPDDFLVNFVKYMNSKYKGICVLTLNRKYIKRGGSR